MKFVHALLLGVVAAQPQECNKSTPCKDAKTCCAVHEKDDMAEQAWFKALAPEKQKELTDQAAKDKEAGNSVCLASDKTTFAYPVDEAEAGAKDAVVNVTYKCPGADDKKGDDKKGDDKKGDDKKGGDDKKDDKKDGDKKDGDKKDGDAKEGERGTIKEGEECNSKEKGKGCVEKMCCGKISAVTLPEELAKNEEAKKKMDEEIEKAKESGKGVCVPDDKTEYEKDKTKMTYECGASALAATAIVALSAMVNM